MFFSNKTRQKMQLARVAAAGLVNNYPHLNLENTLDFIEHILIRFPDTASRYDKIFNVQEKMSVTGKVIYTFVFIAENMNIKNIHDDENLKILGAINNFIEA